jgi:protein SCO1/2
MLAPLLGLLLACWGQNAYIVEGTVVRVDGERVVLDHEEVAGLMPAMTMPFDVADPDVLEGLQPGDRVYARYEVKEGGGALTKLRVTGHGPPPAARGPMPLQPGHQLPAHDLPSHRGGTERVGQGQGRDTVLTFVYTRCPLPEACPAVMLKLRSVEQVLDAAGSDARLVAISLDPAYDTPEVLAAYAASQGLGERWSLLRMEPEPLENVAMLAGMTVLEQDGQIVHGLRVLVLDEDGRLAARYDGLDWDVDLIVNQLK